MPNFNSVNYPLVIPVDLKDSEIILVEEGPERDGTVKAAITVAFRYGKTDDGSGGTDCAEAQIVFHETLQSLVNTNLTLKAAKRTAILAFLSNQHSSFDSDYLYWDKKNKYLSSAKGLEGIGA